MPSVHDRSPGAAGATSSRRPASADASSRSWSSSSPAAVRADSGRALPVKAYKVRPRDISGVLRRIGTVRARAETNLQFGAPGRLARFDAEKGQFLKKGALIAALYVWGGYHRVRRVFPRRRRGET